MGFPAPGNAALLLGFMLLTAPGTTLLTLVTFLGFYWIVSGVLSFAQMFVDRSVPWIWSLDRDHGCRRRHFDREASGGSGFNRANRHCLVFGIQGLVMGVLELIGGFSGGFIRGAINLLIGVLLLSAPLEALAVPFVFAVLLLVQAGALIALALRLRRQELQG